MDQAMDWAIATIVAVIPIAAVIGGLVIAALSLQNRARLKMAAHQDRMFQEQDKVLHPWKIILP